MREFCGFLSCYYRALDPGMIKRYEMLFYHMMWRMCCKLNYRATDSFVAWHPEKSGVFTIHMHINFVYEKASRRRARITVARPQMGRGQLEPDLEMPDAAKIVCFHLAFGDQVPRSQR
jgi:hypothetical protein